MQRQDVKSLKGLKKQKVVKAIAVKEKMSKGINTMQTKLQFNVSI